jgi:hypothetical protein
MASALDLLQAWKKVVADEAHVQHNNNNKHKKKKKKNNNNHNKAKGVSSKPSTKPMDTGLDIQAPKLVTVMTVKKVEALNGSTNLKDVTQAHNVKIKKVISPEPMLVVLPAPESSSIKGFNTTPCPPVRNIPKAGGDATRDRVRELMMEALNKVCNEVSEEDTENFQKVKDTDVVEVAVAVENALFSSLGLLKGKEKAKYRYCNMELIIKYHKDDTYDPINFPIDNKCIALTTFLLSSLNNSCDKEKIMEGFNHFKAITLLSAQPSFRGSSEYNNRMLKKLRKEIQIQAEFLLLYDEGPRHKNNCYGFEMHVQIIYHTQNSYLHVHFLSSSFQNMIEAQVIINYLINSKTSYYIV